MTSLVSWPAHCKLSSWGWLGQRKSFVSATLGAPLFWGDRGIVTLLAHRGVGEESSCCFFLRKKKIRKPLEPFPSCTRQWGTSSPADLLVHPEFLAAAYTPLVALPESCPLMQRLRALTEA